MIALRFAALVFAAGFAHSAMAATLDGKDIDDRNAICNVDDGPQDLAPCRFDGDQVEIVFEHKTVTAKLRDSRLFRNTPVIAIDNETGEEVWFAVVSP